ncbi:MAG: four helix bundle protein [Deltaproteobacteria bacterium]|nr:four helix bundle protein [Deltaproteobacteria bacterium]
MKHDQKKGLKRSFEDLEVWQKACRLTVEIYRSFGGLKDWGFRDQISRSAVSIPSNIAEGFERGSTQEFIRFLFIAKGSAGELRTQLYLAIELGYTTKGLGWELIEECKHVSAMIQNLIKSLERKKVKGKREK